MTQGGERLDRRGGLGELRRLTGWVMVLVVAGACSACGSGLPYVWVQDVVPPKAPSAGAPIQAGDTITVFVQEQEGLSGDFLVGADGSYVQPILGGVHVAGRTPDQVQRHLAGRLRGILAEPRVSGAGAARRPIRSGVSGEVLQPGYFELGVDEGILSGLARAGGLNDFADEDEIFVIRRHPELQRIRVRYRELMRPEHAAARFRLLDGDTIVVE